MVDYHIFGENTKIFGKAVTVHFLVNEIFMVFFFGIATKEITESVLPGGALNPMRKAINPLMGTLGGVVGPAGLFFLLAWVFYCGGSDLSIVANGWGIPTATDIALAWLVRQPGVTAPIVGVVGQMRSGSGLSQIERGKRWRRSSSPQRTRSGTGRSRRTGTKVIEVTG